MSGPFKNYITNISSQATKHYTITPSDTLDLPVRPRAIYVNAAGDAVISDGITTITYTGLIVGQVLTMRPTRILATGTTASLVAWY